MDQRDEFSKWMLSIEEALTSNTSHVDEELLEMGACGGCGAWDCPECFPDSDNTLAGLEGQQIPAVIVIGAAPTQQARSQGVGMAGTHPVDSDTFDHDEDDEIDIAAMGAHAFGEEDESMDMEQDAMPRTGKGTKLGHIVHKFVKTGTANTFPKGFGAEIDEGGFTDDDEVSYDEVSYDDAAPIARQNYHDEMSQIDPNEAMELISKITYMQDMGLSNSARTYSEEDLAQLPANKLRQVHQAVVSSSAASGVVEDDVPPAPVQRRAPTQQLAPKAVSMESIEKYTPSLFESIMWDEEISEAFIEESSLSKLIGKKQGGQRLVKWLHSKHKLGNMADLEPQKFSERMLWKEFKRNPDNFIVVSATNGVAGIKPFEKQIKDRMEAARKKGKDYDPGGDATLRYQIIAFTGDGQQVNPALLQPAPEAGEERESDPTVMKARMGKISGRDTQNSDNVFNLLADQIGSLHTVYLATGAVERDKIGKRADMKKPEADMPPDEAVQAIFNRVRPVLKKLASQALSTLKKRIQRYNDGGNFAGAQQVAANGEKLTHFLATIDTSADVNVASNYTFNRQIKKALVDASGSAPGSDEFNKYLSNAAKGNTVALKPVLDSLRDNLVGLQ